ncbi:MAG TPA: hypothetical protein VJ842_11135 [Pyrinomonadaceae bacterium]|nr:hypothetical protein [Pyrinomonadaceae bacterium]
MPTDNFQIVGKINDIETIATHHSIRVLSFLQKLTATVAGAS